MYINSKKAIGIPIIACLEIIKGSVGIVVLPSMQIIEHQILLLISVLICALKILLGVGLLKRNEEARRGIIILMYFIVPYAIFTTWMSQWSVGVNSLVALGCLVACFYIYYFKLEIIRKQFIN